MTKDNGGPAFPMPFKHAELDHSCEGMTLRDYFAAKFLCGRVAVPGSVDPAMDAKFAYQVADAMLAERAK